ncbi:MAG: hypothetical protein ACLFQK_06400 [Fibrobacterota bacterium]
MENISVTYNKGSVILKISRNATLDEINHLVLYLKGSLEFGITSFIIEPDDRGEILGAVINLLSYLIKNTGEDRNVRLRNPGRECLELLKITGIISKIKQIEYTDSKHFKPDSGIIMSRSA